MYNEKTILIDVSGCVHKYFYREKNIQAENVPDVVMLGLLNDILKIGYKFKTNKFVFLFEGGKLLRKLYFPEYKVKRSNRQSDMSKSELEAYLALQEQMFELRTILPYIGFKNVFWQIGYEADDLFAVITKKDLFGEYVIVSSDEDLYQLLTCNVSMYNPYHIWENNTFGKLTTYESFQKEYDFNAENWWKIKALAGCKTDEVPGVFGVGEAKAIQFFNKTLNKSSKIYQKLIAEESKQIYNYNVKLVKLPYEGCKDVEVVKDEFSKKNFMEIVDKYHMYVFQEQEFLNKWKYFFLGQFGGIVDEQIRNRKKLSFKVNLNKEN